MTKLELAQRLAVANTELMELRAECSALRTQLEASRPAYPFTDKQGKRYRMQGNVKCYQPTPRH